MSDRKTAEKVYAAWLGKVIGVIYGAPVEGWTYEQIRDAYGDLTTRSDLYYLAPMEKLFGADDDTSMPSVMLQTLLDEVVRGRRSFTALELGKGWLNYIPEDHGVIWRGGYGTSTEHTAFQNLLAGIAAPLSGSAELNGRVVAQQIGGQIFSDIWGLLFPNDPGRAALWADMASSVSHDLDGRIGGRFIAAMVSAAFGARTIDQVVKVALASLPQDAHYTQVMRDIQRFWSEHPDDWVAARQYIAANYGYDRYAGVCHIIPNAAIVVMALLYGRGDFDRSIRIANAAGWDTDCNAGNVGAIVGALVGVHGIPAGWREPLEDRFVGSSVLGARNSWTIPAFSRLVMRVGQELSGAREPDSATSVQDSASLVASATQHLSFDFPGSTEGVKVDDRVDNAAIHVEQSDEYAYAGNGSLRVVLKDLRPSNPGRIVYRTLLRPVDFYRPRYDPAFSPVLYAGQTARAMVLIPADQATTVPVVASAGFFVRTLAPAPGTRAGADHFGSFTKLIPGVWTSLEWTIPVVQGMITEIGIEFRVEQNNTTYSGPVYVDEFRWHGPARLSLDFADAVPAFGAIAGWTYAKGHWRLEDNAYVGSCADYGETYTGSPEWTDLDVEACLTPERGPWHLVLARVQGCRRSYGAGLGPDGRLVIVKNLDGRWEVAASSPYAWRTGISYRIGVTVRGTRVEVRAQQEGDSPHSQVLSWEDMSNEPLTHGCVGLSVREGSRLACTSLEVRTTT